MPPSHDKEDVSSSLAKLKIESSKGARAKKPGKKPVADSWEDESSGSECEEERPSQPDDLPTSPPPQSSSGAKAPPPTPLTPNYNIGSPVDWDSHSSSSGPMSHDQEERRRPEKTDAVARRMIASALGVKVPRMTEEQRAYDRSVKEQERKRRDQEKAAERQKQEEANKAKAAMWED